MNLFLRKTPVFRQADPHLSSIRYRADIDGLRAVAILSVFVFHFHPLWLPGGFVGVDVFFVISGFLISNLIFKSVEQNQFSFFYFYLNRIKRIFPALIVVLIATFLFGCLFLLKDEMRQLGRHLIAAATFTSNMQLRREAGYFDEASFNKPLLHLWSLAVEEQYYLFWPIAIFIFSKNKNIRTVSISVLLMVSLAWSIFKVSDDPRAAFFSPWTRFWELWMGSLLASLFSYRPKVKVFFQSKSSNVLSFFGFLLIGYALFRFNQDTLFPGVNAIVPCLGAFLIIGAENSWVNQAFLGNRILVSIGLFSYPLYLWHWPIISCAQIIFNGKVPSSTECILTMVSFLLAFLTYQLVEKRIRAYKEIERKLGAVLIAAMIGILFLGLIIDYHWIKVRLDNPDLDAIVEAKYDWGYPSFGFSDGHLISHELKGSSNQKIVFMGDSHMEQYWPRIQYLYEKNPQKFTSVFATYDGCSPLPSTHKNFGKISCDEIFNVAFKMAEKSDVKKVIFAGYWESDFELGKNSADKIAEDFEKAIRILRTENKEIYLILSNPTGEKFVPNYMLNRFSRKLPRAEDSFVLRSEFEYFVTPVMNRLIAIAERQNVTVINPLDSLCDAVGHCPTVFNNTPLYKDADHIRAVYAKKHVLYMDSILE